MLFKLTNTRQKRSTHCGVLEFVANEGKAFIPHWVIWIFIRPDHTTQIVQSNKRNIRKMLEICSICYLTPFSNVFIVDFEQVNVS